MEFQKPSEELRAAALAGRFRRKDPLEGVDFPYLARSFELTGGSIKNIALNAAFWRADRRADNHGAHTAEPADENQKARQDHA